MWIGIVVAVIVIVLVLRFAADRAMPETLSYREVDDVEMMAAIAGAQKTLPMFWDKKASALNPDDYSVKVKITDGDRVEHFWLFQPALDGEFVTGILDNDPGIVKTVKVGDKIRSPLSDVSDWMYTEGGKIHGNYTGRVLARPENMKKAKYEQFVAMFAPLPEESDSPDSSAQ